MGERAIVNPAPVTSHTVERIREAQAALGLTQVEMALYLGVPHSTLCGWLQGQREPNTVVARLLDVLGTMRVFAPGLHQQMLPKKGGR